MVWIEKPAHEGAATAAGAAMQHQNRAPRGIAALLDIKQVTVADIDDASVPWLDRRMQASMCRVDLSCRSVHATSIGRSVSARQKDPT